MVTADAQLQLRWHSHSTTFTSMLSELHSHASYSDVIVCCLGGQVEGHRAVLSLCSPYLAKVLNSLPVESTSTTTLMLPEVPLKDVLYLMSFIYCGQVDVPQANIASFLNTGKFLQILGLEQGDRLVASPEPSDGTTSSTNSDTEDDAHSMSSQKSANSGSSQVQLPTSSDVNDNVTPSKTNTNPSHLQQHLLFKQEQLSPTGVPFAPSITIKEEKEPSDEASMDVAEGHFPLKNIAEKERDSALISSQFNAPLPSAPMPVIPNIIGSDGRIDLNFYLQQAVQTAAMPCPLCKKEFKSQSGLRDHIRLHTGERPFICEFCHMNFARASHLKRHRRMHTGEKPFHCSICGKEFSRGDKLKDHLKRHESEDKLTKIRTQIFNPEDCSKESSASVNKVAPVSPRQPLETSGGNVSNTSLQLGETMANLVARANHQAVTPNSVMGAKTSVANAIMHRQLQTLQALHHQAQQQLPQTKKRKVMSENDAVANENKKKSAGEILPQMLGVASIGDCILSPIN